MSWPCRCLFPYLLYPDIDDLISHTHTPLHTCAPPTAPPPQIKTQRALGRVWISSLSGASNWSPLFPILSRSLSALRPFMFFFSPTCYRSSSPYRRQLWWREAIWPRVYLVRRYYLKVTGGSPCKETNGKISFRGLFFLADLVNLLTFLRLGLCSRPVIYSYGRCEELRGLIDAVDIFKLNCIGKLQFDMELFCEITEMSPQYDK